MPANNIATTGQAANFQWGLPNGIVATTYGRVQSVRAARESEKEPLKDGLGNTDGMVYYDMRKGGTVEAIIPSTGVPSAEIAETVTINGDNYYIEGFEVNWTSGAWAKITLTLTHYDGIAIGSNSST